MDMASGRLHFLDCFSGICFQDCGNGSGSTGAEIWKNFFNNGMFLLPFLFLKRVISERPFKAVKKTEEPFMRQSLEELIACHQISLYTAAFSVCRNVDDANDVVQDTFIQYYTSKKQFRDKEHLKAWLLRVAINRARDISRSFWKRNRISIEECMEEIPFENQEEHDLLETVMKLPEKYREVIHLYYYEELSVKEISEILRITEGSVKMRLSRGRKFLRDVVKEEES